MRSLNRTSVGLKFVPVTSHLLEQSGLNRTSVGLKFVQWPSRVFVATPSLNRTSVGLKSKTPLDPQQTIALPQSNQRGIEIERPCKTKSEGRFASIEPAWD